jgi:hypothetical protein
VLWAYMTTPKKLTKHTPFNLEYGKEVVVVAKFVIPNLIITQETIMPKHDSIKSHMKELMGLEEDHFLAQYH